MPAVSRLTLMASRLCQPRPGHAGSVPAVPVASWLWCPGCAGSVPACVGAPALPAKSWLCRRCPACAGGMSPPCRRCPGVLLCPGHAGRLPAVPAVSRRISALGSDKCQLGQALAASRMLPKCSSCVNPRPVLSVFNNPGHGTNCNGLGD